MAIAASTTIGARSAMQASWRPLIFNSSGFPVSVFSVICGDEMLEVGLTTTRATIGLPLVIPPVIPPALFVAVVPSGEMIGSLCSLPRIEKRFAERVRYAGGRAFDDTAYRILRTQRGFDDFREIVRVVAVVDLKDAAFDPDLAAQYFFCYHAGRDQPEGQPAGEVSAAAVIGESPELLYRHPVRMRRARMRDQVFVVARQRVFVVEQRRSCGR